MLLSALLAAGLGAAAAAGPAQSGEARVSLDLKEADATDVVSLLAQAADRQPVFDPGIACRLTVRLTNATWRNALAAVLRACSLGIEESNSVLRVAPISRLTAEQAARRRPAEEARGMHLETVRLSYARAAELAPLLQKLLPRGQVSYEPRTNTVIITY